MPPEDFLKAIFIGSEKVMRFTFFKNAKNDPVVKDMVIKKKKGTYNEYDVTLSWGQIETLRAALEQNHSDPVADESLAEITWYMERVAGPGVEQEEIDAKQKAQIEGGGGTAPGGEGDDLPIPMPPGGEAGTPPDGSGGAEPTYPPGTEGEEEVDPLTAKAHEVAAQKAGDDGGILPGEGEPEVDDDGLPMASPSPGAETNRRLPRPPIE